MRIFAIELLLGAVLFLSAPDLDSGRKLRQEGKFQEALVFFQNALAAEPGSLDVQRELGHCWVLSGRYREALGAYAPLADSSDPAWRVEAAKWSGLTHLYLGEVERGLEEIRQEADLAKQTGDRATQVRATRFIGHVYTELGQFGPASDALLVALDLSPDDLDTLHQMGLLAARQGDWGSLRYQLQDLEQAVRRSGHRSQMDLVYHLQAELALGQGKPGEARDPLDKISEPGARPVYQETRARIDRAQDNLTQAETSYRALIDSTDARLEAPVYYVKALLGLAEVLDAEDRKEEASPYYRQFLEHWGNHTAPLLPGVAEAEKRLKELQDPS
jgi:tetratricopeptide (TPR) repeat protein